MNINIPEKYADLYVKALTQKKRLLEDKIEDFRKEIEEIDNHISALTSMSIFHEPEYTLHGQKPITHYRSEWSWTRKIAYYQEITQKLFTSSEIVDFIIDNESTLDKTKVRSSISAALSNKHRSGSYKKFPNPVTGKTYYGPAEWFINDRQPDPKHLPEGITIRLLDK